ncbi:BrnT family toxin [Phyllobacterium endophyticum]|uniref:BrnT family toxin n=1 Tax=Phyllobacterium endophyticum TaxID=1149773 RepID=A0A2P7AYV5_9HYPH|nr:BrnT family toxin [Phyllobacterium endophyticum]MBB3236049.1 hypothetical protein [Phyllobacterium endophyticum]PSH59385.1 hypothetical protein CU100_00880 [Phyllobacterium endophyticum]TYR41515.1 BrnT family toxin [Phyllobacterium endophyticum]
MSRFVWDEEKNRSNLLKHKVGFDIAEQFQFGTAVEWLDLRTDYGEERIRAIGLIATRLFVLVYTERGDVIRVISLRPALRKDVNEYVESKT